MQSCAPVRRAHPGSPPVPAATCQATNVTFKSCEVHNTGARLRVAGHGIEAVQAHDVTVRDCYLHE